MEMLFLPAKGFNTNLVQFPPPYHSVRNSPRKSADAEAFAEAYLHFIIFVLAIKMPRQLNSFKFFKKIVFLELKKKFFVKEKKIDLKKKIRFYKTKIIHVHLYSLFIPSFHIF